ncbi:Cellular nucleic acid-binding protein-like protein [Nymphaea thermarum]|nr:Cellular nucleic acid-binding protein-like protein [Nymphaea thermarum]
MAGIIISEHRSRSESEEERTRRKAKKTKKKQQTVILLDGSDEDREANEDLTDEILEKAKKRMRGIEEPERDVRIGDLPNSSSIIEVSSSDGVEVIDEVVIADINVNLKRRRAKERRKNKKTKRGEEDKVGAADGKLGEEDKAGIIDQNVGISKSPEAMAEEVEITTNTVLRKLLRGPRYFDPPGESWGACYNCGEVGHAASKCLVKKPKKPCYICGKFGHAAKSCSEVHTCFICKRTGHRAKNCLGKQNIETLSFCLHCGSLGHDMSTCTNDYDQEDLKEIQCYICRQYGHLCCADFVDTGPSVVSCYSCGQIGHAGSGCAKDKNGKGSTLCYKCGEEGHLARGCNNLSQSDKKLAEPSTPRYAPAENGNFLGFKSVPHDSRRSHESWGPRHREGSGFSSQKFRQNNGWITNGGYSPSRHANLNEWGSPKTPFEKGQWNSGLRWHGSQSSYIPSSRSSNFRYSDPRSSYTPGFGGQRFQSDASSSWRPRQYAKFAHQT